MFDTLKTAAVTIIDVRAGLLSPTLMTLAEIGFLAAEYVDTAGIGFDHFNRIEENSAVMRGYVMSWLRRAFRPSDDAKLIEG